MAEEIEKIEKKVDAQIIIKKALKNVAWYNFAAYFLYGFAVAQAIYTPRWDVGLTICMVGAAFNILSWKNINKVDKLSKGIV